MTVDWRYQQIKTQSYLRGTAFIYKPYRIYRDGWDHDHCAACWVILAEPGVEGEHTVHEGYSTTAQYHFGADYVWVCANCFEHFREVMAWADATSSI